MAKVRVLRLPVHAAVVAGETRAQFPSSQGRPPAPSMIPAPIPTAAVRLPQALPVAGIDLILRYGESSTTLRTAIRGRNRRRLRMARVKVAASVTAKAQALVKATAPASGEDETEA